MWFFRWMFGYGHRPGRALWWALGIVIATAFLFNTIYTHHQMAPASGVVLTSDAWIAAVEAGDTPLDTWENSATSVDYPTFQPILYALDLFIPLDALGQESAWAPSPERGWLGKVGFWVAPGIQLLGWIMTAVAAAALTGIIGRKD